MRKTTAIAACTCVLVSGVWWSRQPAEPAKLVYKNVGVTDNTYPTAVAVKFESTGEVQPEFQGVTGKCDYSFVIAGPGDPTLIPDEFSWKVDIADVDDDGIVHLLLQWTATDVPLDLLAVVRMEFAIEYGESGKLTTDPMTFLVANNPKVQEAIASGAFNFGEDYHELTSQIESLAGYKTQSVQRLLAKLSEQAALR